ncbi:platelet-derived growth factor receptor beta-like isoform X2 [Melanotaenia boesemani]|uniref:platelet-derived growth factor receptor beta-like isoform X2 n=1 Tax=Melanotaenia boesemani TaxID=1250792 RepID=UPI001C050226|nr:platelet-derived growth factor receptor beta-like isoform X2 [Melanotaenia boesemani]
MGRKRKERKAQSVMMASSRGQTGSLNLLHFLLGVLLVHPERGVSLELLPSTSEVLLQSDSTFTVACSGWSEVRWRFPQDSQGDGVQVEDQGSSSILHLSHVTWKNSGRYTCEETSADQKRHMDIFIPGRGPDEWFVPNSPSIVMKETEEGTVPCLVSDPRLKVSLIERLGKTSVSGMTYEPGHGFTGRLNDTSYMCVASNGDNETESQVYYVFSIEGESSFMIAPVCYLSVSVTCCLSLSPPICYLLSVFVSTCLLPVACLCLHPSVTCPSLLPVVCLCLHLSVTCPSLLPVACLCLHLSVPQVMEVDLSVSSSVLKRGEVLMINCTVKDAENVFFSWRFPRSKIRSFVNITTATVADSGVYVCEVGETKQGRRMEKNITVTVLDRGYVYLWPSGDRNVSSVLHDTAVLTVDIDAHPTPTVLWTRDNQTISMETTTTHLTGSRYMSTLTLRRLQMDQTGSYTATASNEDDSDEVIFYLEVKAPPKIRSLSDVGSNTFVCVGEGAPPPVITWYTCHSSHRCSNLSGSWRSISDASEGVTLQEIITEVTERDVVEVRNVLTLQALSSVSAVRCEARNSAGERSRDLQVLSNSLLSQVAVLAAVVFLVIIAIIFLIILIVLWRKKPHYKGRWKVIESVSSDGQQIVYMDPADLPYSSTWEIPRDHVVLGQVLGSGGFGRVVEATVSCLTGPKSTTKVAVKMVKTRTDAVQSLMSELKVLVHLGPHLNIVNLLGACTRGGPVYLITEFCRHGDLLTYLQKNRHTLLQGYTPTKSDSDGGYMDMNKEESVQYVAMKELSHAAIKPAVYETAHIPADQQEASSLLLNDSPLLTHNDLISFSFQISQAMEFLSFRKCVHRDLAARNVLICDGKLVKVCDFGLARDLLKHQDYIVRGNSFLPLKWMSPESIFQNIYSFQSDVWSFGVLLWEIFSLGGRPYSDFPLTQVFSSALKNGLRLDRPENAPHDMYDLMKQCWKDEPQSRPSFSSLVVAVGNMMSDTYKQHYIQLTENFLEDDSPAVVQSRWSSSRNAEYQTDRRGNPPEEKVNLLEEELVEASHSHNIPAGDISTEGNTGTALDAVSPLSDPPIILQSEEEVAVQEVISSKKTASPPASSCCHVEEESCM